MRAIFTRPGREQSQVERRVRDVLGVPRVAPHDPLPSAAAGRWVAVILSWWQRRVRVDPGRRGALAAALAAFLVAIVTGWWVLVSRPHTSPVVAHAAATASPAPSAGSPVSSGGGSARASPTTTLVVDVVGKVRRPGVCRLPPGARVADALQAAGGALPGVDLTTLNLARKIADGDQIAVGVSGAPGAAPGPPGVGGVGPSSSTTGPIDLNSATAAQLDTLPGVGPVLAQNILDWRSAHGRFDSVDQLREVSGIGPSKFATIRPLVTV